MVDDWNLLKVKRVDLCGGGRFWIEDDIDILRKKIVALIEKSMNEDKNPLWVIKEINRLFGVDK